MAAKIFRINYKSDFILTLNSDAGWMIPFCIKFWTSTPSQAFFAQWDGTTYTHCAYDPSEPTKLLVQFDDHHLPIGDLKYQVAYHFTVADFPNDTEDEVINPANITTEIDGETYQVMLDFTGETAPEIEFSLPAYANEAQRIANEQQRIAHEQQRINDEQQRIANEETRQAHEAQRIAQETARINEFATLKSQSQAATRDANDAATLANQKAQLAADKAALANDAATLANQKAQLAADKAALANDAAQLANEKAALAQQKAEYAQTQGGYAKDQGDYAKNQGDYAKEQGDTALADHQRAESDHGIAVDDHTQAGNDHTRAESDHGIAVDDHTQAGNDHTRAESDHGIAVDDHTQAGNDHTRAESDHGIAADDHTQAGNDHTRAESDHTRAESDHDAVELYVDSLGVFDLSKHNAVGGVLATYADLSAALTALNALDSQYKYGGMSFKFVQSSDNKYVQYRLMADSWSANTDDWVIADEGVYVENPEFIYVKTDAEGKILWAIKTDGTIYFGAGVPPQVVEYIEAKIAELSLDEYEDIVAFLNGLEEGENTLQQLLNLKANKANPELTGKISLDKEISENDEVIETSVQHIDNPEFVAVWLDKDEKILFGVQQDGNFYFGCGVPQQIVDFVNSIKTELLAITDTKVDKVEGKGLSTNDFTNDEKEVVDSIGFVDNIEYIKAITDNEGKILEGIKADGTKVVQLPLELQGIKHEAVENTEWIQAVIDKDGRILEGFTKDGEKYIHGKYNTLKEKAGEEVTINTNYSASRHAITNQGAITSSASYLRSDLIKMRKGNVITVNISLNNLGLAIITKTNVIESVYDVVVPNISIKRQTVKWEADEDCYVVVNKNGTVVSDPKITIYTNGLYYTKTIADNLSYLDSNDIVDLNGGYDYLNNKFTSMAHKSAVITGSGLVPAAETPLLFCYFSDIHGQMDRAKRIIEFKSRFDSIAEIIHGGDLVKDRMEDENIFSYIAGGTSVLNVIGNHDIWKENGNMASEVEAYTKFIAPYYNTWGVVLGGDSVCYWHKDYTGSKVRVIGLDALHWNASQSAWLQSVLESAAEDGYSTLIVTHYPPAGFISYEECTFSSIYGIYTYYLSSEVPQLVQSAINDHGLDFICYLFGHMHKNEFGFVADYPNQCAIAIEKSCAMWSWEFDSNHGVGKSQDSMFVVSVDAAVGMLTIINIGNTSDKFNRQRNYLAYDYRHSKLISNS